MILLLFAVLALLSAALYLGLSRVYGFIGFPLDDAWIHQTFARTLAESGRWGFFPGEPSAGSTSPLWTLLLAPGHILLIDFRLWTYFLGAALLLATAVLGYRLARTLFLNTSRLPLALGLFLVLEWHLNWAAFSGMETLLFVALSLLLLDRYFSGTRPFFVGLLSGLLTLTRPEGLILFTLLLVFDLWQSPPQIRWPRLLWLLAGFAVPTLPYLAFNLLVAGNLMPNTFYAKHAEYSSAFGPWWLRPFQVMGVTLVGPQVLLIPGFVWSVYHTLRNLNSSRPNALLILGWWASILLAYTVYLPLTYQHGRYLIPTIPFFILLGLWGTWNLFSRISWFWRQTTLWSTSLLLIIFWVLGAEAYARDVRIMESELVEAARWVEENTPPQAIIAAHDIGAVGFFAGRELVDTAGLVTSEVIPFIRDEDRLLDYIEEREVDYFIFFPSWYPRLAQSPLLQLVWRSPNPWVREEGEENIAIYRTLWK